MTVEELIKKLTTLPKDHIIVITDPEQKGWANIEKVIKNESTVNLVQEGEGLFHN